MPKTSATAVKAGGRRLWSLFISFVVFILVIELMVTGMTMETWLWLLEATGIHSRRLNAPSKKVPLAGLMADGAHGFIHVFQHEFGDC